MTEDPSKTDIGADNDDLANAPQAQDGADAQVHDIGESNPVPDAGSEADQEAVIVDLNDRLLRSVAELENFRRRSEKERQDTAKFAIANFARDCLSVLDNLRRGLDSVTSEARTENPAMETLAAGMEMTERELIATFERHGITKNNPMGEKFDYDFHQAMFEVPDPTKPAGIIVQVVQPGYLLNGRLLRPAMVGVTKGGAAPEVVHAPIANEEVTDDKDTQENQGPGEDTASDGEGAVDTKA